MDQHGLGRFTVVTNEDRYRSTEPMGRPFDGRIPRYRDERDPGQGWPAPAPESQPYPYGRLEGERRGRQPVAARVVRTGHATPPQPTPIPEPFIANLATAKNTNRIARELRYIVWMLFIILLLIAVVLFCEIELAVQLGHLTQF